MAAERTSMWPGWASKIVNTFYPWLPMWVFIHSFILDISIVPLQVHYYSEVLPTQHGYCVGVSRRSAQATASKGLPKVPTWRLERDLNPQPSGRMASTLPMRHHVQQNSCLFCNLFMSRMPEIVGYRTFVPILTQILWFGPMYRGNACKIRSVPSPQFQPIFPTVISEFSASWS